MPPEAMRHSSNLCVLILLAVCLGFQASAHGQAAVPQIVDITASTGIHFEHRSSPDQKYIVESMSGGVALIDFDGDGWLDIYLTNAPNVSMGLAGKGAPSALYRNNHDGTFTDVAEHAGVAQPCWAMGAAVGDIDNDGWPDLAVSCFGGVVLYRNNHDGTFTNATKSSGLSADEGWATGVTFGDYDGDGFVDLFVPHYVDFDLKSLPQFGSAKTCQYHEIAVQCGPRGLKGKGDTLWHNNGNGTFTEVSKQAGVDDPKRYFGLGALWSDFDNDGLIDLLVANDGEPNYLYKNLGGGRFQEIGTDAGVAFSEEGTEQANMGLAVGDYTRTGNMSIAVSHFSDEYMELYRNDGKLNFTDVAHSAAIAKSSEPYVGWGDAFLDVGNRGLLDLLLVNGHVYPQVDTTKLAVYREPKVLYWNTGDGKFRDVTAQTGPALSVPQVSRGLAVGDLFHRGALDLVVENLTGGPMILQTRPDPANHWVQFRLLGSPSNRLALNARGGSYLSQSDLSVHFGLADAAVMDKVEVLWPDGKRQQFKDVPANRFLLLEEGGSLQADPKMTIR